MATVCPSTAILSVAATTVGPAARDCNDTTTAVGGYLRTKCRRGRSRQKRSHVGPPNDLMIVQGEERDGQEGEREGEDSEGSSALRKPTTDGSARCDRRLPRSGGSALRQRRLFIFFSSSEKHCLTHCSLIFQSGSSKWSLFLKELCTSFRALLISIRFWLSEFTT